VTQITADCDKSETNLDIRLISRLGSTRAFARSDPVLSSALKQGFQEKREAVPRDLNADTEENEGYDTEHAMCS
jgi:hypothetical protein